MVAVGAQQPYVAKSYGHIGEQDNAENDESSGDAFLGDGFHIYLLATHGISAMAYRFFLALTSTSLKVS